MNGWVKLHRKILENELIADPTALQIFTWLLLNVDKNTGKTTIGRYWTSKILKQKPTTFYAALKRLENKYKIVSLITKKMTIKYTEVSLLNWAKYQSQNDSITQPNDNLMTIQRQSNDNQMTHIQEYKNREDKNIYNNAKNFDKFSELKKTLNIQEENNHLTKEFQVEAIRIIKALGISAKRKGAYFKAVKEESRNFILKAYAFAVDHPNVMARDKMFFWKLNELKNGKDQ